MCIVNYSIKREQHAQDIDIVTAKDCDVWPHINARVRVRNRGAGGQAGSSGGADLQQHVQQQRAGEVCQELSATKLTTRQHDVSERIHTSLTYNSLYNSRQLSASRAAQRITYPCSVSRSAARSCPSTGRRAAAPADEAPGREPPGSSSGRPRGSSSCPHRCPCQGSRPGAAPPCAPQRGPAPVTVPGRGCGATTAQTALSCHDRSSSRSL
mmetsp:Transcript_20800/g.35031  ORF Transcript_20800/g.35031 Transcript_20800/m.35031 type:complete len:211 (+) Transcript_20800:1390-2022(+)